MKEFMRTKTRLVPTDDYVKAGTEILIAKI